MRLAVIGDPVAHSRSPAMHTAALASLGREDVQYTAIRVRPEALGDFVREGARAQGLCGFNVTVPHKRSIMPLLDEVTPAAAAIGAVNTVTWDESRAGWIGANTDAPGFGRAFDALVPPEEALRRPVAVLGGGGAARAVVAALCDRPRVSRVVWITRDVARLEASGWPHPEAPARVSLRAWDDWRDPLDGQVLVQTTPLGLPGHEGAFPRELSAPVLASAAAVFDLVVPAGPGSLVAEARRAGVRCCDGRGMLVWQGQLALARWLCDTPLAVATPAVHAAMTRAVEASLSAPTRP